MGQIGPSGFNWFGWLSQVRQIMNAEPGYLPPDASYLSNTGQTSIALKLSLAELFNNPNLLLGPEENAQLLKDLAKFPQDLKQLLADLSDALPTEPKLATKPLADLLEQQLIPLKLPLKELQVMVKQNLETGSEKLLQLMQSNQLSQTKSVGQLGDLLYQANRLGEKLGQSPQQAAETLILLALPWCPLLPGQKLQLDFEFGEGGEDGSDKEISVILYLQTNQLGRFKVQVFELQPLQILVKLHHEPIAKPILKDLEAELNDYLAKEGLPESIFETIEMQTQEASVSSNPGVIASDSGQGFKGLTRQADHTQIDIQAGEGVSVLVFQVAYALAKLILSADARQQHLQSRKKK